METPHLFFVVSLGHHFVTAHVPDDGKAGTDEDQLHHRVVYADEIEEQVEVAGHKNKGVQFLSERRKSKHTIPWGIII